MSSRPRSLPPPYEPARLPLSMAEDSGELLRRFGVPAALVVIGILTTIGDGAYAASNGAAFTLGPIHLAWLAASMVIAGIGLAVYRLLEAD